MTIQTDGANADQIAYWNEVAGAKWVTNQDRLDRLMAPLGAALLDEAAAREGEHALDIGCGCGDVALRLADRVGSHGRVLAVDVSRPMLAHAEARRAALVPRDRALVRWLCADAMVHGFARETDVLVSRFGIMFFDDRPRAFANLRAALRPDGRFAFLTWRRRSEVAWMRAPMEWIAPLFPTPEEESGAIGPFALADADATCRLLEASSFRDVVAEAVDRSLILGDGGDDEASVDEALALLMHTGPAAALLRDSPPEARAEAAAAMRAGLRRHVTDGAVRLDGACWLYSGRA